MDGTLTSRPESKLGWLTIFFQLTANGESHGRQNGTRPFTVCA
jgi:hypothetical protein